MKKSKRKVVVTLIIITLLFLLSVPNFDSPLSVGNANQDEIDTNLKDLKKAEFYKGNFSVSDAPILNRTVELVFTLETVDDAPNTTIKMFLPEGIELVEGNLLWNGDIKKDEKIEHKISIKVVKEGEWRIRAWVENEKFSGFNRAFFCYIDSGINSGNLSKKSTEMPEVKQKVEEK